MNLMATRPLMLHGISLTAADRGTGCGAATGLSSIETTSALLDQYRAAATEFADLNQQLSDQLKTMHEAVGVVGRNLSDALKQLDDGEHGAFPLLDRGSGLLGIGLKVHIDAARTLLLGAQEALKSLLPPESENGAIGAQTASTSFDPTRFFGELTFQGRTFDPVTREVKYDKVSASDLRGIDGVEIMIPERDPTEALLMMEHRLLFSGTTRESQVSNWVLSLLATLLSKKFAPLSLLHAKPHDVDFDRAKFIAHATEIQSIVNIANVLLMFKELMSPHGEKARRIDRVEIHVHSPELRGDAQRNFLGSPQMGLFMEIVGKMKGNFMFSVHDDPCVTRERFVRHALPTRFPLVYPNQ